MSEHKTMTCGLEKMVSASLWARETSAQWRWVIWQWWRLNRGHCTKFYALVLTVVKPRISGKAIVFLKAGWLSLLQWICMRQGKCNATGNAMHRLEGDAASSMCKVFVQSPLVLSSPLSNDFVNDLHWRHLDINMNCDAAENPRKDTSRQRQMRNVVHTGYNY